MTSVGCSRGRRVLVRRAPSGHRIGESHHRAKLTTQDVVNIRALRECGLTYHAIAHKFEVAVWTVRDICSGRARIWD